MTDHEIKEVFAEAVAVFSDGFQSTALISGGVILLRIVQMSADLRVKGDIKKKIVLLVFQKIIEETGLFSEKDAKRAVRFIETALPAMIDEIKSLSRTLVQATNKCCGFC